MESNFSISSSDMIKLVLQYLKENHLSNSYKALEEESHIRLNSVESTEELKRNVIKGKWDLVLKTINHLELPLIKLMDLYEQIVAELIESNEGEVAKTFFYRVSYNTFTSLLQEFPNRTHKLESLINGTLSISDFYSQSNITKESNRMKIADKLSQEFPIFQQNRLRFFVSQGISHVFKALDIDVNNAQYNIFTGTFEYDSPMEDNENTSIYVKSLYKQIKFEGDSHVECCRFSYDGKYIATGSSDGFIEIWNPHTGKLSPDLNYQLENVLMFHNDSVLAVNFSKDCKLICSGDNSGCVKLFKVSNGKCLGEYPSMHSKGITCLAFTKTNSAVISGSFDTKINILGLKSGKSIKELAGHSSFINDLEVDWENDLFYSSSSDGTVKIWNLKHYELINTISPPSSTLTIDITINSTKKNPRDKDSVFVSNKTGNVYLMSLNGEVIATYSTERQSNICSLAVSSDGQWLYCCNEENILFTFSVMHNVIVNSMKIHEKDIIGLVYHPTIPMLASFGMDGLVNIYT